MQHTIDQLVERVSAIHTLAIQAHRLRYERADGTYDEPTVNHIVEQIQAMCGSIYNDRQTDFSPSTKGAFKLAKSILDNKG